MSIERFKQALYWAELAQQYMPPGLAASPDSRTRSGCGPRDATLEFPKEKEFPRFLLEQDQLDFSIGGTSAAQGAYAGDGSGADLDAHALRPAGGDPGAAAAPQGQPSRKST